MMKKQDGWVVAWLVVMWPLLVGFLGLVLDGGILLVRGQMLDTDAAALAATDAWDREHWKWNGTVRIDPMRAESLARQYLAQNMPSARLVEVSVNPANRVSVRTEMSVPFFFMRVVGMKEKAIGSFSTALRRNRAG